MALPSAKSFRNNHLQTFFLKLTSGTLPTFYNKHTRYPTIYEHSTCLYCGLASDKQDHWPVCTQMKHIWLDALHQTLLRLMMHIQLKVDIQANFQSLLSTFDDLSPADFSALISDLLYGFIRHSDIKAMIDKITISSRFLKSSNLRAKFLYYFIQSVKTEVWHSHCKKIIEWEKQHNIDNKDLRKRISSHQGSCARIRSASTHQSSSSQLTSVHHHLSSNVTLHATLLKTKQLLSTHIRSGFKAIWGFNRFNKGKFLL